MRAIRDSVRLIVEHPQAWRPTDILGIEVKLVRQYPFKVFYRILEEQHEIEIVHVRTRRGGRGEARPAVGACQ